MLHFKSGQDGISGHCSDGHFQCSVLQCRSGHFGTSGQVSEGHARGTDTFSEQTQSGHDCTVQLGVTSVLANSVQYCNKETIDSSK